MSLWPVCFALSNVATVVGFVVLGRYWGELLHARTAGELIALRASKKVKEPQPVDNEWIEVGVSGIS